MKKDKSNFELLEHTADLGIAVRGSNLKELFRNAALGTTRILSEVKPSRATIRKTISLISRDRESLLISWLNEIIYYGVVRHIIFSSVEVLHVSDGEIKAVLEGRKLAASRASKIKEVKAATYHGLKITESSGGLEAQVIFDL